MTRLETTFIGGLVLGFAGSLHCACTCGCIASGANFVLNPNSPYERVKMLLKLQIDRSLC